MIDEISRIHLEGWLERSVEATERAAVRDKIFAVLHENPTWLTYYSWPELLEKY